MPFVDTNSHLRERERQRKRERERDRQRKKEVFSQSIARPIFSKSRVSCKFFLEFFLFVGRKEEKIESNKNPEGIEKNFSQKVPLRVEEEEKNMFKIKSET